MNPPSKKIKNFTEYQLPVRHRYEGKEYPPIRGWWTNPEAKVTRTEISDFFIISPFDGYCPIGCDFCFQNNPSYNPDSRDNRSVVRLSLKDSLPKALNRLNFAFPGLFNYFTEPFNPLEEIYNITELCVNEFLDRNIPIVFMTRKCPPQWATEALNKNPYNFIQFSINTMHNSTFRLLSPHADDVKNLLKSVEILSKMGIYVVIRIDPFIPGITKLHDVLELIDECINVGAKHFTLSFVRFNYNGAKNMMAKLGTKFPHEYDQLLGVVTENIHGNRRPRTAYRLGVIEHVVDHIGRRASFALSREHRKEQGEPLLIDLNNHYMKGTAIDTGKPIPVHIRSSTDQLFQPLIKCPGACISCKFIPCGSYSLSSVVPRSAQIIRRVNVEIKAAIKTNMITL